MSPSQLLANSLTPPSLRIIWEREEGRQDSAALDEKTGNKLWATACGNLSNGLVVQRGPWGMGVFASVSCFAGDKKISGPDATDAWTLRYRENDTATTLKLFWGSAKDSPEVASAKFEGGRESMQYFLDQGFSDLISLKLLNQLPMMGWIEKGTLIKSDERPTRSIFVPPTDVRLYKSVAPPKDLNVFKGEATGKFLMPEIVGKAIRSSFVDPGESAESTPAQIQNAKSDSATISKFQVIWRFDESSSSASRQNGLWVQDARGSKKLSKDLDAAIADAVTVLGDAISGGILGSFLKGIKASTTSGYIGARYGKQIFKGNTLLEKTSFFGLLAEVRGGPLAGLRYYWDKVPAKKAKVDGLDTSIEWSRHILGKSFGFNLGKFVDRLDLTPKLGVWSFDAQLVDSFKADGSAATVGKFKIARGFSLSLEAGAEWLSSWYTIRPWYSYDYAGALGSVSKKRVTSSRVGLDTFWSPGKRFNIIGLPLKPTLLGFFIYETISLSSNGQNAVLNDGQREIVGVTFSSGYAGAGVAVTW